MKNFTGTTVPIIYLRQTLLQILKNPHEYEWSLQGFGMLRLYLTKTMRLHLWHPRFAVPNVTTLHTHPWDFRSLVVVGRMVDRLYEAADGMPTHRREEIVCGPGGGATGKTAEVHLRRSRDLTIEPGCSYQLDSWQIHESFPELGTATIVHRTFHSDTEHAFVYVPTGEPWVSAEPRKATREEVSEFCKVAIERPEWSLP